MSHQLVCRAGDAAGAWAILQREGEAWHLQTLSHQSLPGIIGGIIEEMRKGLPGDFTFTDQNLAQLAESPVPLAPEALTELPIDISCHILLPEGLQDGGADLCTSLWRAPGGSLSSPGRKGRFRLAVLADQVQQWFVAQGYRTFAPPHPTDPPGTFRPDHGRALCVRLDVGQGWSARALCPQAFPGEAPEALRKRQMEIEESYQRRRLERDPIERHKRLQEQWERERQALKGSPEQRAEVERERKERVGLTPVAKITPAPAPVIEPVEYQNVPGGGWTVEGGTP
jgi:hypothetical protein